MTPLVTGGAGLIDAILVLVWITCPNRVVVNFDNGKIAGNPKTLVSRHYNTRHFLVMGGVCRYAFFEDKMAEYRLQTTLKIVSVDHVDRSISRFVQASRLVATYSARYWNKKSKVNIVHAVRKLLDKLRPKTGRRNNAPEITCVTGSTCRDRSYNIDANNLTTQHNRKPAQLIETVIRKMMMWYPDSLVLLNNVQSGIFFDFKNKHFEGLEA